MFIEGLNGENSSVKGQVRSHPTKKKEEKRRCKGRKGKVAGISLQ